MPQLVTVIGVAGTHYFGSEFKVCDAQLWGRSHAVIVEQLALVSHPQYSSLRPDIFILDVEGNTEEQFFLRGLRQVPFHRMTPILVQSQEPIPEDFLSEFREDPRIQYLLAPDMDQVTAIAKQMLRNVAA